MGENFCMINLGLQNLNVSNLDWCFCVRVDALVTVKGTRVLYIE